MKFKYILIIIFFLPIYSFSQYSEKITKMTYNLTPIDTLQIITKFKNGIVKHKVQTLKYEFNDYIYQVNNGELTEYYKNGTIKTIILYDAFGIIIGTKAFDKSGNFYFERKATKIDTKANELNEFLSSFNHLIVTDKEKEYKYSKRLNKWYLHKTGMRIKSKKVGEWKILNENGLAINQE